MKRQSSAFTLVEILVVLVVISIMGAMVTTALQGVTTTAREARTKSIIATIDGVLAEQYNSYKYRPLAVEIPDLFRPSNLGQSEVGMEVLASEAARVRLMMLRDLQRMEMPDRLSDILGAPSPLYAAANPVRVDPNTGSVLGSRELKNARRVFPVSWFDRTATYAIGGDNIPSKLASYRSRIGSTLDFTSSEALANQGAECLYLIMATSYVGGSPAIDSIPESNIGDTDNDGLREILDGWGQPLGFVRWPVGYFDVEQSLDTTIPDDFDLFRSDFAYAVDVAGGSAALATDVNSVSTVPPWSMRPLVVSAGPDGEFGIATNPWSASLERSDFDYTHGDWYWPATTDYYGTELPGRTNPPDNRGYPFPDPYLRRFVATNRQNDVFTGVLPGQLLSSPRASPQATDNLSNYQLQAVPR